MSPDLRKARAKAQARQSGALARLKERQAQNGPVQRQPALAAMRARADERKHAAMMERVETAQERWHHAFDEEEAVWAKLDKLDTPRKRESERYHDLREEWDKRMRVLDQAHIGLLNTISAAHKLIS